MRAATSPKCCTPPAAPTRPPRRSSRRSSVTSARRTWPWSPRCARGWRLFVPACRSATTRTGRSCCARWTPSHNEPPHRRGFAPDTLMSQDPPRPGEDRLRPLWDPVDLDASKEHLRVAFDEETTDAGRAEVLTQLARVELKRGQPARARRILDDA